MGPPIAGNDSDKVLFDYTFSDYKYQINIKIPISVPCTDDPTELAHRAIQHHNLPVFLEDGQFLKRFCLYQC